MPRPIPGLSIVGPTLSKALLEANVACARMMKEVRNSHTHQKDALTREEVKLVI